MIARSEQDGIATEKSQQKDGQERNRRGGGNLLKSVVIIVCFVVLNELQALHAISRSGVTIGRFELLQRRVDSLSDAVTVSLDWNHSTTKRTEHNVGGGVQASRIRLPPLNSSSNRPPKFAYIISAHLTPQLSGVVDPAGIKRWETCIFPALNYTIPASQPVYVVLLRKWTERFEELCGTDPLFREYAHRIKPVYVDCGKKEVKSPYSLCCKEEKGILNFYDQYMFDDETGHAKYDWVGYQDDDTYIRHDGLQNLLGAVSPTDRGVIATTDSPPGHRLGSSYKNKQQSYSCRRKDPAFMYPYGQPLFYNYAAMDTIVHGLRLGGLVKQCLEYNIEDDVGNALMHWMYQFPRLWIRGTINAYTPIADVRADFITYHGVARYPHNYTFEEIHTHMTRFPYNLTPAALKAYQHYLRPLGYSNTSHFQQHGMPQNWTDEWYTMPTKACQGL